jgi:hypothetical protein
MTVTVELRGRQATVEAGVWQADKVWLTELLYATTERIEAEDPDPDMTHAERAIELIDPDNGRIVSVIAPEFTPGRVY